MNCEICWLPKRAYTPAKPDNKMCGNRRCPNFLDGKPTDHNGLKEKA